MCWYIHHTCQLIWEEKAGRRMRRQHTLQRTCSVPHLKATPQLFMALTRMILQKSLFQTRAAAPLLQTKRGAAKIISHKLYEWLLPFLLLFSCCCCCLFLKKKNKLDSFSLGMYTKKAQQSKTFQKKCLSKNMINFIFYY